MLDNVAENTFKPIKRISTDDKTWIYKYDSETVQQSNEWGSKDELTPKNYLKVSPNSK